MSETSETARTMRRTVALSVADSVAKLATAIDAGQVRPSRDELRILAEICDRHYLVIEAARIRRWLGFGAGPIAEED